MSIIPRINETLTILALLFYSYTRYQTRGHYHPFCIEIQASLFALK